MTDISAGDAAAVFGRFDENAKLIESAFGVRLVSRDGGITVSGGEAGAEKASAVLRALSRFAAKGEAPDAQRTAYVIESVGGEGFEDIASVGDDVVCVSSSGKPVRPKTLGQKRYVRQIREKTVVFSVGPAGTGKTYLAMAAAITAFKRGEAARLILTRPAIEAGEKLGFLPGDLQQKVDPYLRPLFDILHEMMGAETFARNMEKGSIEVAPLAYMRGRTLDNAWIVLDEAQNTTPEQMKMFLTRLGHGSKAIITGDLTQVDLPGDKRSGLSEAIRILRDIEGIGVSELTNSDVARHPLVQKIVKAYEKEEGRRAFKAIRRGAVRANAKNSKRKEN
ncbi:MAG: PhoH family protein [Clostridiales bacterium]|nr:PhoH family protein [Clostridiales bacterium]